MLTRFSLLLFAVLCHASVLAKTPKELYWEDMVPEDFVTSEVTVDHMNNMTQAQPNAPVRVELDGQFVKIPGFVVPLEGTATETSEFLLVPYFGACIHVPPPPSNQIVFVKFAEPVPIDNLYDAVWVTGTLTTERWTGDIASVSYSLSGVTVAPYE
ncbi:MAG: DUF3299 domain-containing protein [Glaciecola sp.]|jgi:hypothetical protein